MGRNKRCLVDVSQLFFPLSAMEFAELPRMSFSCNLSAELPTSSIRQHKLGWKIRLSLEVQVQRELFHGQFSSITI